MAAVAKTEFVTITINDTEIQVPKGELIVESVKRLGLEIPIFCYHPRMKAVGMCRMCLVEVGFKQPDGSVRKMPKPQAGCTLPASDGMVVYTDSEQVHKDRKGVLEFLLINHPLDCPICDRGGECPLQNNTIFYGPSTSRFTELKRHLPKAYPLSSYVTLDLERCIQCGRCVRFTEEISGDSQLAFRFRGAEMQPSTFQLLDFESKFSGNVIEICPVGALTSARYRFRARPWDLETKPFNCLECSNHCSVWFDYRAGKFVRMNGRTNEAVNEEWTCDKGKFGQDWINSDKRLKSVIVRKGNAFVPVSWSEGYEEIISCFSSLGGDKVAALVGGRVSNEGLFLLKQVFEGGFGSANLDSRWTEFLPTGTLDQHLGQNSTPDAIADFETKKTILVFGTSLADDEPMMFLRVRKAWFQNGARVVNLTSSPNELDRFAAKSFLYTAGSEAAVAEGLRLASTGAPDSEFGIIERQTGLTAATFGELSAELGDASAIIATRNLLNVEDAEAGLESLKAFAAVRSATLNIYSLRGNEAGAEVLGVMPGNGGLNTKEILEACADFRIKALWLVDCNPFELFPDKHLVADALESVDFLVVQGCLENDLAGYASVVLPQAAPAEQDGSYTNAERRVQITKAILPTPGDAKASWRIFAELLMRLKPGRPYFNSAEVLAAIQDSVPAFRGIDGSARGDGFVLNPETAIQVEVIS